MNVKTKEAFEVPSNYTDYYKEYWNICYLKTKVKSKRQLHSPNLQESKNSSYFSTPIPNSHNVIYIIS